MGSIQTATMAKAKAKYKQLCKPDAEYDIEDEVSKIEKFVASLKSKELKVIDAEYNAKNKALPTMLKVKTAKYRLERFNSTDADTFGEKNIKINLSKALSELSDPTPELTSELNSEANFNEAITKVEDKAKERLAKNKTKQDKNKKNREQSSEDSKNELAKERPNDYLLRCNNIAKAAEEDIESYKSELEKDYLDEEKKINDQAKTIGYGKGAADVQKYNDKIAKQAMKIINKKRNAESKLKIKVKAAIQVAKMKIYAQLGL